MGSSLNTRVNLMNGLKSLTGNRQKWFRVRKIKDVFKYDISIKVKLVCSYLIFITVLLTTLGVVLYSYYLNAFIRQASESSNQLTNQINKNIESYFEEIDMLSMNIAYDDKINKALDDLEFYCKLLTTIVDKSIELSLYNHIFKDDINPYDYLLNSKTIYNVENYLLSLLENLEKGTGIELKTQYGETIGKVMSYVLLNYYKDINLNKVSEELSFNPSYLSAKFKEITQYSFNEYLNTVRINNAKKLLAERKYKFNQISDMVGYNDQRYFCKIFKKVVGITPREYINALSFS